jgi:hypothetical protein
MSFLGRRESKNGFSIGPVYQMSRVKRIANRNPPAQI